MIPSDHDGRLDDAAPDEVVDGEAESRALAIPEPEDARGKSLKLHARGGETDPSAQRFVVGEHVEREPIGRRDVAGIARQGGRMNAGTKPGILNASSTPAFSACARMLLP